MNRGIELPQLGKATLIWTEFLGVFSLLYLTINTSQNSTEFFFETNKAGKCFSCYEPRHDTHQITVNSDSTVVYCW